MTSLATRYGIVTPYTAFLLSSAADITVVPSNRPVPNPLFRFGAAGAGGASGARGAAAEVRGLAPAKEFEDAPLATKAIAGRLALDAAAPMEEHIRREQVIGAKEFGEIRKNSLKNGNGTDFYRQAGMALNSYAESVEPTKRNRDALQSVRYIGDRTFYNRAGQWQESMFKPEADKPQRQISVGSKDYLDLLNRDAKLAKFFALGNVVIQVDGEWIEVK